MSAAAPAPAPHVRVQAEPIDVAAELAALELEATGAAGAVVGFTGLCRDESGRLEALELEHYPGMAEQEIGRIAAAAAQRWSLLGARAVHRFGLVRPGETIVLVACASIHREAAFEGARYLMDFLKTRAPFWKREHLKGGGLGDWVEAKDTDDLATDRWRRAP